MELVNVGEVVELDHEKEYICVARAQEEKDYLYLISNFKPLEVKFAYQYIEDGELCVCLIGDQEEKKKVLRLFAENKGK